MCLKYPRFIREGVAQCCMLSIGDHPKTAFSPFFNSDNYYLKILRDLSEDHIKCDSQCIYTSIASDHDAITSSDKVRDPSRHHSSGSVSNGRLREPTHSNYNFPASENSHKFGSLRALDQHVTGVSSPTIREP
ncbi:hypothetical protein CBL_01747 [Carabus blaptoides fortunei]